MVERCAENAGVGSPILPLGTIFCAGEKLAKNISIRDAGLYTKFILASFFMFALPLLLTVYILIILPEKHVVISPRYANFVTICIMVSGVFGFLLIRKTGSNILNAINAAKNVSEGKTETIMPALHEGELKELAGAFNRITSDLDKKISELEYSRKLTKELFRKIGDAVTSSEKLDSLLNIIIQSMVKVFKAEASFIALYDRPGGKLYIKDYSGARKDIAKNMELPDDKGIIGLAIKNAKPMILEKRGAGLPSGEILNYNNISCVPIAAKNKIMGLLGVIDQGESEQARAENLSLIENIASQIAVSIGNFELNKDIETTYYETLVALARVVEAKDPYTKGHLERVAAYVGMMADKLKLDDESKKTLKGGAVLHDLGKVGISDNILKKEDSFTPEEYEIMKQHTVIGENILKPLRSMGKLSKLVRYHHELYDGSGYPDGLKGADIPLLARILTVADMYDALITERPYRKAMSREEALNILKGYSGNKLDPELVDMFVEIVKNEKG